MPGWGASSEFGTAVLDAGFFFGGGADKGRCGCGWVGQLRDDGAAAGLSGFGSPSPRIGSKLDDHGAGDGLGNGQAAIGETPFGDSTFDASLHGRWPSPAAPRHH